MAELLPTIFNGSLRPSPNHNICAFYKHIPIYSDLKNRADRSINLLFTLELFKLKILLCEYIKYALP